VRFYEPDAHRAAQFSICVCVYFASEGPFSLTSLSLLALHCSNAINALIVLMPGSCAHELHYLLPARSAAQPPTGESSTARWVFIFMPMVRASHTLQNNFTNGESFLSRSVKFTIWPLEKSKREVPTCNCDVIINC
jgi:hypothetical protein